MRTIFLFLIFLFALTNQLFAIDIMDALSQAYKNNTELNAERQNINTSKEDLKISKGNYLPTATITGSKSQEETNKLTNLSVRLVITVLTKSTSI